MDFLCLLDDIATTVDSLDIVFGKLKRRPFFRTSPNKMKKAPSSTELSISSQINQFLIAVVNDGLAPRAVVMLLLDDGRPIARLALLDNRRAVTVTIGRLSDRHAGADRSDANANIVFRHRWRCNGKNRRDQEILLHPHSSRVHSTFGECGRRSFCSGKSPSRFLPKRRWARDLAYWGLGQGGGAAQITMSDPNRQFSRRGGVPSNDQIRAASVRARESLILSLIPYLTALATSSFTISASGIAIVIGKQADGGAAGDVYAVGRDFLHSRREPDHASNRLLRGVKRPPCSSTG